MPKTLTGSLQHSIHYISDMVHGMHYSHCVQLHQINKKKPVTSDQQDRGLFIHPFYLREHNHGIFNLVYTNIEYFWWCRWPILMIWSSLFLLKSLQRLTISPLGLEPVPYTLVAFTAQFLNVRQRKLGTIVIQTVHILQHDSADTRWLSERNDCLANTN